MPPWKTKRATLAGAGHPCTWNGRASPDLDRATPLALSPDCSQAEARYSQPMATRKIVFIVFSDDACRQNHALLYTLDLHEHGHDVKLIIEGAATRMLGELGDAESRTGSLLRQACTAGLVVGACERASSGCASDDPARKVADVARAAGIPLLSDLQGHAGIEPFVRQGYEIVVV